MNNFLYCFGVGLGVGFGVGLRVGFGGGVFNSEINVVLQWSVIKTLF